jgi:hypothetical protein
MPPQRVTGENAGTHVFYTTLCSDIGTLEYSYSGTVQVDGHTYTFKS